MYPRAVLFVAENIENGRMWASRCIVSCHNESMSEIHPEMELTCKSTAIGYRPHIVLPVCRRYARNASASPCIFSLLITDTFQNFDYSYRHCSLWAHVACTLQVERIHCYKVANRRMKSAKLDQRDISMTTWTMISMPWRSSHSMNSCTSPYVI